MRRPSSQTSSRSLPYGVRMRSARILALLALASTLSGCGSGTSHSHSSVSPSVRTHVIGAGATYVAMGDSYTAAPFIGPSAADDGCLRTQNNYPHQVAAKLGLKLTDVSCGGATTGNITGVQTPVPGKPRPPQIDALTASTALVTISIGGNDGGVLAAVVGTCPGVAGQTAARTGSKKPCTDLDALAHGNGTGTTDRIDEMEKSLVAVLEAIAARAPHARVVVVSYPDALPATTCPQFPLMGGDGPWAAHINEEFVAAQRQAAKAVGAEFVDMYTPSVGHDMCSSDPWVAGEHPTAPAAAYHPYAIEQTQIATALEKLVAAPGKP